MVCYQKITSICFLQALFEFQAFNAIRKCKMLSNESTEIIKKAYCIRFDQFYKNK